MTTIKPVSINGPKTYEFYIATPATTEGGNRHYVIWRNLTLVQARNMYVWTEKSMPDNVVAYGWGQAKGHTV